MDSMIARSDFSEMQKENIAWKTVAKLFRIDLPAEKEEKESAA